MQSTVLPQYERTLNIPHVKMTYSELLDTIRQAERLVLTANQGASPKSPATETLSFSDGTDTLKMNVVPLAGLNNPPRVSYSARYEYTAPNGSPISGVSLTLTDYSNEVTVSGSSNDEVETIATTVQANFADHSVWSGQNVRIGLSGLVLVLGVCLGLFLTSKHDKFRHYLYGCVPPAVLVLALSFSGLHILPGTAIYAIDPSFLSRYEAQIGAVSLLVTVAFGVYSVLQPQRRRDDDTARQS